MFWKIIATGFGAGYAPIAPGTAGAVVGCLVLWGLQFAMPDYFSGGWENAPALLLLILLGFFLGVQSANKLEKEWGHDPSKIVVDELIGVWIAMLGMPFTLLNLAIALLLFRIFDIWKPWGVRQMERLPGGWGVMMDDVAAGVYSCLLMHIYLTFSIWN